MKDERDNKNVPFPARLLTGALVLTGVMLVAMAWSGVDSYRSIATVQLRDLRIAELRGAIVHLDEVLTMSARMAAATGDSDWERRYRQFEPQLDAAIKEAMELTAHSDSAQATAQTDAANLKLVEMENQIFTLIRAGEAGRAKAVLFSDAYEAQKKIYAEGMVKLIQHLKEQLTANQRKKQREAFLSIIAVACCLVLFLFTWLAVLRRLNYWRTMQSANLDALTRAEEALRKLNDGLEKRVEDRTRSLQLEIQERKDAEAEVQRSQKRLRDLIDGLGPSMFVGLMTPQGIVIEANRPALAAAGLKPEDVLGKLFEETYWWAYSREVQQQLREAIARAARGEASRYDVQVRAAENHLIDIDFSLQPLRDETGEVVFLIPSASVITERKQTENALRESHEKFRQLADNITDAFWIRSPDLHEVHYVSPAFERIWGRSTESLYANPHQWADAILPEDRERVLAVFATLTGAAPSVSIEYRIARPDGEVRWVHVRGFQVRDAADELIRLTGIVTDITERRRKEEALHESEEHFRFLNDLAEATRTLADPEQIMAVMARMLGERLRASRCAYADVEKDGEQFTILHDYTDGCASTVGKYHLSLFGARAVARLHSGQKLIIRSVDAELLPGEGADMFNAIGIQAIICCPLIKDGSLRAMMAVHQTTPRDWTSGEVAIVQEVVERCWATIERRTAEEKLRQSEALLRIAGRTAGLGGWAVDLPEVRITWSDEVCAIHEVPPGTVPGLEQAFSFYAPQSRETIREAFDACAQQGTPFDLELEVITHEGSPVWVRCLGEAQRTAAGAIPRVQGAFQDITERKRAENALRESEERFRRYFELGLIGMAITSPDKGWIEVNDQICEMFGYQRSELLQITWAEITHPADLAADLANFNRVTAGEVDGYSMNKRFFRKDGRVIDTTISAKCLRRADGSVDYFVVLMQDITERKRAEAELEKAQKKLLDASRQAGMAEVATGVLHNVGNVLNSVNVSATLLAEQSKKSKVYNLAKVVALMEEHAADLGVFITNDPTGKQLPGYLAQLSSHLAAEQTTFLKETDQLRKNVEHIKDIVAMQQSYAKVSGVTETLKISDLVEDALRMNASALTRHEVAVVREFAEVPPVTIDKHKVLQVLVNLIRNAKYACADSGRTDKRMTVRVANGEGRIKIAVIDNGVGIPPENLIRIFNHGFTTRTEGHGFGLHSGALAAKEMGGALVVHSDGPGRGASFTLELPVDRKKQAG